MTRKQELLSKLKELGFDKPQMKYYKKLTTQRLEVVLKNIETHDIITRVAKRAGEKRKT